MVFRCLVARAGHRCEELREIKDALTAVGRHLTHEQRRTRVPTTEVAIKCRARAIALRRQGLSYREIGEALGTSSSYAWEIVAAGMRDQPAGEDLTTKLERGQITVSDRGS